MEGSNAAEAQPELARVLAERLDQAAGKWPEAVVDELVFARRLGELADGVGALENIESSDVYLATGCLANDSSSIGYLAGLVAAGAAKWAGGTKVETDDLGQRVLTRLLLAEGDAPPKLTHYEGRAPLVAYLKSVTRNLAVSLARMATRREPAPPPSSFLSPAGNPEQDAMRLQFREAFSGAIDQAFASLDDRHRAVIAMHYADGIELDAIAKVYRVHRVTVSRWLADARAHVFTVTRQNLRVALGLSDSEFGSALRVIQSQLEVSLSTIAEKRPSS